MKYTVGLTNVFFYPGYKPLGISKNVWPFCHVTVVCYITGHPCHLPSPSFVLTQQGASRISLGANVRGYMMQTYMMSRPLMLYILLLDSVIPVHVHSQCKVCIQNESEFCFQAKPFPSKYFICDVISEKGPYCGRNSIFLDQLFLHF